jgi:hypothetical protein
MPDWCGATLLLHKQFPKGLCLSSCCCRFRLSSSAVGVTRRHCGTACTGLNLLLLLLLSLLLLLLQEPDSSPGPQLLLQLLPLLLCCQQALHIYPCCCQHIPQQGTCPEGCANGPCLPGAPLYFLQAPHVVAAVACALHIAAQRKQGSRCAFEDAANLLSKGTDSEQVCSPQLRL